MVTLSDEQQSTLRSDATLLDRVISDFKATTDVYKFPDKYDALVALMERQKTAISNLLTTGDLGCGLESLRFDEAIINNPHLVNIRHTGEEAKKISDPAERERFVALRLRALHHLKTAAQPAADTFNDIADIINPRAKTHGKSGTVQKWAR